MVLRKVKQLHLLLRIDGSSGAAEVQKASRSRLQSEHDTVKKDTDWKNGLTSCRVTPMDRSWKDCKALTR